jgi:hypothetical protein
MRALAPASPRGNPGFPFREAYDALAALSGRVDAFITLISAAHRGRADLRGYPTPAER